MTKHNAKRRTRPLVNEEVVAERWGVSVKFVRNLRTEGGGPRYFKLKKAVRYDLRDVDQWANQRRRRSTSDRGGDR